MRYSGAGCTTERAAQPGGASAGTDPTTCKEFLFPAQNLQGATLDSKLSFSGSSPVMTHERVIGSLRNCILARITLLAVHVNSATNSVESRRFHSRNSGDTPSYMPDSVVLQQQL